mmetsp:Transcript_12106/g.14420  ORF Transcript_12106/g.14420 Transcript_12106/m.14420 type:complete len:216 (+) Transcript_12106:215-862(+)
MIPQLLLLIIRAEEEHEYPRGFHGLYFILRLGLAIKNSFYMLHLLGGYRALSLARYEVLLPLLLQLKSLLPHKLVGGVLYGVVEEAKNESEDEDTDQEPPHEVKDQRNEIIILRVQTACMPTFIRTSPRLIRHRSLPASARPIGEEQARICAVYVVSALMASVCVGVHELDVSIKGGSSDDTDCGDEQVPVMLRVVCFEKVDSDNCHDVNHHHHQ